MSSIILFLSFALFIGQPPKPPELLEKKKIIESWLSAAEQVAKESGNPQAKAIVKRLKSHYALAEPSDYGVRFKENRGSLSVGIIVIFSGQKLPTQRWQQVINSGVLAFYIPEANCIVIKEDSIYSDFIKGIVLIKEGFHAQQWQGRQWDFNKPIPFYEDEVKGYEFTKELVDSIKGQPFIYLLESNKRSLKDAMIRSGILPPQDSVPQLKPPALEQVFLISSSQEKKFWENYIFLLANFALADELAGHDKATQIKIGILRRIYPNLN